MYLGIYTREEKMCPQDAVFLRDSLESVVSSERLFGKRSFSTASTDTIRYRFSACRKSPFWPYAKAGFCISKGKNSSTDRKSIERAPLRFFLGEGFFLFHFQVASFFKFMAANLSFTQLVT